MNVFFDVDYTILGMDGSLRPGTEELFGQLDDDGHHVYVWSGFGDRTHEIRRAGLERFRGAFRKPLSDFGRGLCRCGVPVVPDFVVDDHPGIVQYFGGFCIRPYRGRHDADGELRRIPALLAAHVPDEGRRTGWANAVGM